MVFEKIKETADFPDEEQCRQKVRELATKFRENFYKAQVLSKTERKERMKKFGKLNLDDIEVGENCDEKQQFLVRGKNVLVHNTEEDSKNKWYVEQFLSIVFQSHKQILMLKQNVYKNQGTEK